MRMEKVAAWSPNNGVLIACPRGTGPFRRVSHVQAMARAQVRCDCSLWRRDPQPCSVAGARRKSVGRCLVRQTFGRQCLAFAAKRVGDSDVRQGWQHWAGAKTIGENGKRHGARVCRIASCRSQRRFTSGHRACSKRASRFATTRALQSVKRRAGGKIQAFCQVFFVFAPLASSRSMGALARARKNGEKPLSRLAKAVLGCAAF